MLETAFTDVLEQYMFFVLSIAQGYEIINLKKMTRPTQKIK